MKVKRGTRVTLFNFLILLALSPAVAEADTEDAWTLAGTYTGEMIRNSRGGLRTGNAYLDNFDLTLEMDGSRSGALPGVKFFAYGLYNNAATFSERFSGDAQTVSNIDAPRVLRLYEAWLEWTSGSQGASLKLGLTDLNAEFDNSDGRGLFINSSFGVGHELGQTGNHGPSIFPVPALGVRAGFHPGERTTLLAAVFDGDPGDPQTHSIHLGGDDGALAIAEWQYAGERFAKTAIGAWHYTRRFEDGYSSGAYALTERRMADGVDAFARIGFATANEYDRSAQAGLVFGDSLGLGVAWASTGDAAETAFEVTYRHELASWLAVQPDIQFIVNPGTDPSLRNSVVIGLRFEMSATRTW